jgi:glycosidase
MEVARYWIDEGADGWRLDVPNEINDDSFWAEFRQVVKAANQDAYLVGEIWTADARWVSEGHFDGLMNYPVMDALTSLLMSSNLDAAQFSQKMGDLLSIYPQENTFAMLNLLGSHDTERILTRMGNNLDKTRLAYLFQFAFIGAPVIYYGDEIGLVGGKDPACRGALVWEETTWNHDLRAHIKRLITLRKKHAALRKGEYTSLGNNNQPSCLQFARTDAEDQILIAMNASAAEQEVSIDIQKLGWEDGKVINDLLYQKNHFTVKNGSLELKLPAWSGTWLG